MREQLTNNAASQLDGAIDDTETSITVDDGSPFPATGNFRLIIDSELLLCTDRSGNTLTVSRGAEGTTAASHLDDAPVTHILTVGSLDRTGKDNVPLWGGSAPALNQLLANDGSAITAAGFTWVNQGGATVSDQSGTIALRVPSVSGENCRIKYLAAPSAPYSYVAAFQVCGYRSGAGGSVPNFGIGFRDSSNGKMVVAMVLCDSDTGQRLQVSNLDSETSWNSSVAGRDNYLLVGPALWFKIENDNTNTKFYISADGIEFVQIATAGKAAFTSALDQVFFYGNNPGAGADLLVRLLHWHQE